MALNIKYQRVFDIPVSPDSISTGSVNLASFPSITGDFVTTVNLALRTYTFNLQGINETKAQEIIDTCNANAELLATGQIDLNNPTGIGQFTYRGAQCVPFSYEDGGTLSIGNGDLNYNSFNVTVLTNVNVVSV